MGKVAEGGVEMNVRLAHHTAVITGVEGDVIKVVEQNGAVPLTVSEDTYYPTEMIRGRVSIYRVVGEKWLPPLDGNWD